MATYHLVFETRYGTTTETEITVLFFRNGTETIYDDAIVAVSPF